MISKIIAELADKDIPLSTPLLKLKVIAKRIKNETLSAIVSKELDGYTPEDDLPTYRMAHANSFATIQQGWDMHYDQPIPHTIFDDKLKDMFTKFPFYQGIEVLENLAKEAGNDSIAKVFGVDFGTFITNEANKAGVDFKFGDIRITTNKSQVIGIIGKIRNKLLDLLLALESDFPDIDNMIKTPLNDNNEISTKTNQYMAQINITTSGDGNIINTGSGNELNVTLTVNKNDLSSLQEALKKLGVEQQDIEDISEIVKNEGFNKNEKKLGIKSQNWIQKMVGKSLDGTWKVGVGTAAGLLVKIITSYFGI